MKLFKQAAILVVLSCTIWAQQEPKVTLRIEKDGNKPVMREAQVEPKEKPVMREAQVESKGNAQVVAPHANNKPHPLQYPINAILEQQKKAFGCVISEEEMRVVAEKYMKANPIVIDSPKDITRANRLLIPALRKLGGNMENADKIFQEMELEKKGVNKMYWNFCLRQYSTEEKIKALEAQTPKTQEELDKYFMQMCMMMKGFHEAGLLCMRILIDYNMKHKDSPIDDKTMDDWGAEAVKKKEKAFKEWWSEKLAPQYPDAEQRKELCDILVKQSIIGIQGMTGPQAKWRPYFLDKMQKWNIKQEVGD